MIKRKWFILDANDQILGRLASQAAYILRGKHKPEFTPHMDLGDHIIIVNAEKIKITGKKMSQKLYDRFSGYPGGLKQTVLSDLIKSNPERVIKHAVKGMLPKNVLGRKMFRKLRVYSGPDHQHQAQNPEELPNNLRKI